MKAIIFLPFILLHSFNVFPQTDSIGQLVDTYISEKIKQYQIPGASVAVIKNNVVIKQASYGFSNLDNKVPVTSMTIFPIASMDKQIIATCIMMLYEQNKLKLTDSISKFLDSIPSAWHKITINHLLSHTSGLPDEVPAYFNERYLISYSTKELLENIKKQGLQFEAGSGFIYSDANFLLLQLIVEKISGISYGDFLKINILLPLGMNSTQTLVPKKITPNRATSYYKNDSGEIIVNTWRYVDFGPLYNDILTTPADLVKYDIAIATNKLLKQETYNMMWTPFVLNDGSQVSRLVHGHTLSWADVSYGYGWFIRKFRNHRIIYHAGWTGTSLTRLPDDNLSIILFTNLTGDFDPDELARYIAGLYVPESSIHNIIPKKDPHPKTTVFVKEQIINMGNGTIDRAAYTVTFADAVTPVVPKFTKSLQKFGSLQSLEYLDEEESNGKIKIFYKANFASGVLYYQVSMTKENKIAFISVEK